MSECRLARRRKRQIVISKEIKDSPLALFFPTRVNFGDRRGSESSSRGKKREKGVGMM